MTTPAAAQPAPPDPTVRRVVIAEDEALIRMDLAEMLGEQGYQVVGEAGDGARAVELAEQHRPDLVILDVKMPVLDGIAATIWHHPRLHGDALTMAVTAQHGHADDAPKRVRDAAAHLVAIGLHAEA